MITAAMIVVSMCQSSTLADWTGADEELAFAVNPTARLI